jgi:hypothetical protein
MKSLRSLEGEVLIDHTDAPGVPAEFEVMIGLKPGSLVGKFECATVTCRHCQTVVMLRPDRSRERHHCRKCDHYICDTCASVYALDGVCRDIQRQFDEALEKAFRESAGLVHTGFAPPIAPEAGSVETPTQIATSVIVLP